MQSAWPLWLLYINLFKRLDIQESAFYYYDSIQEDLLIHGDSVYDIIDKQDHQNVQNELGRPPGSVSNNIGGGPAGSAAALGSNNDDGRIFLCRINVSRNARRQMRFGDQKVLK